MRKKDRVGKKIGEYFGAGARRRTATAIVAQSHGAKSTKNGLAA